MIQVYHVFKKNAVIPKSEYTPELRKSFFEWGNQLVSRLGVMLDKQLLLTNEYKDRIPVTRTGTIVIQDIIGYSGTSAKNDYLRYAKSMDIPDWFVDNWLKQFQEIITFHKEDYLNHFEAFSLDQRSRELYIKDGHKLCDLKLGKPVNIRLNAKWDFTASGRRERSYSESDYIIQYLGEVETIGIQISYTKKQRNHSPLSDQRL